MLLFERNLKCTKEFILFFILSDYWKHLNVKARVLSLVSQVNWSKLKTFCCRINLKSAYRWINPKKHPFE